MTLSFVKKFQKKISKICLPFFPFKQRGDQGTERKFPSIFFYPTLTASPSGVAAQPVHQHGGWYRLVGQGVLSQQISKCSIIEQFASNNLPITDVKDALLKDVVQVPSNGYVVLRTRLDNPGAWLLRSQISPGMALVLQVGESGDWTVGPADTLDVPCPM